MSSEPVSYFLNLFVVFLSLVFFSLYVFIHTDWPLGGSLFSPGDPETVNMGMHISISA